VRAALERPALVVCHAATLGEPVADLAAGLDELGLSSTRILCVGAEDPVPEDRIVVCLPERLFETVVACLPSAAARSERAPVRILASLDRFGAPDPTRPPVCSNVLELAPESLLVEAPVALDVGEHVALHFFVRRAGTVRATRVSLTCTVEACSDASSLHYEMRVDRMDAASRRAIHEFLSEGREARKG
jgi:hypothetical protein